MSDKMIQIDSYSLQEEWINNIARNFLDVDNDNLLRAGLFGYVNEVMSNSIEDTNFMTNSYYNEIIPVRANLPDSIYSYASQLDYDTFNAEPARQNFILAINKKDIITNAIDRISYKEFIIGRNSYLEIDNQYKFIIDYPIKIVVKKDPNNITDYVLTPIYDLSISNPISTIKNPYISSTISKLNNEEFLFLNIHGSELTVSTQTRNVTSATDILNNTNFEFTYTDQLSHFKLFYKETPNSEKEEITTYFIDELDPKAEKFCFYKYKGQNSISISFSAYSGYFRPAFNSEIIVEFYTTQGSKGNFFYSGSDSFFIFNNETDELKFVKNPTSLVYISEPSAGGKDCLDIKTIKKKVIDQFSIRKNIITESDLNKFFNDVNYNSDIFFIKKRDDIFRRIYSSFILAKDANDNILPTNTINIEVHEDEIDVKNEDLGIYIVKNKVYNEGKNDTFKVCDVLLNEGQNDFKYIIPFLLKFKVDPISVNFYNTYKDEYKDLAFSYISNTSVYDFIINNIHIQRNPEVEDDYKLTLELATTLENKYIMEEDLETGLLKDTGNLKIKALLYENDIFIGYVDFYPSALNHNNKKFIYKANLKSSDYIDNGDRIEIINSIKGVSNGEGVLNSKVHLGNNNIHLELCVFHKNGSNDKNGKLEALNELQDYSLVASYKMEDTLSLFRGFDRLIYSNLQLTLDENDKINFKCKGVPVISYDFFKNNKTYSKEIHSIIEFYSGYLRESLINLENNFDIDIKFFNTYGKSKLFTVGRDKEVIDRVNLQIKFRIKTDIILDVYQKNTIREYIRRYIESINNTKSSIFISNLITLIENEFAYVKWVEFLGINDYDTSVQIIESTDTNITDLLARKEIKDYVPEYLNINKLNNKDNVLESEVYIEFV